ncbi:hypothetical protein Pcinc_005219 [Petrolisthes cinctipes]|uniref:Uncharacterized protein n=1 Tax=Petrolisthes cinctipes TaxID=88211 RepID=A0AAE1KZK5_PETCI|nr:hypothetical protein Pcinc_005219 [Petrolisthes cinctipes]
MLTTNGSLKPGPLLHLFLSFPHTTLTTHPPALLPHPTCSPTLHTHTHHLLSNIPHSPSTFHPSPFTPPTTPPTPTTPEVKPPITLALSTFLPPLYSSNAPPTTPPTPPHASQASITTSHQLFYPPFHPQQPYPPHVHPKPPSPHPINSSIPLPSSNNPTHPTYTCSLNPHHPQPSIFLLPPLLFQLTSNTVLRKLYLCLPLSWAPERGSAGRKEGRE